MKNRTLLLHLCQTWDFLNKYLENTDGNYYCTKDEMPIKWYFCEEKA